MNPYEVDNLEPHATGQADWLGTAANVLSRVLIGMGVVMVSSAIAVYTLIFVLEWLGQ